MLKRVTLINFMSHRHTVIDFADGLTVIAGENNCGKSAIVAAIQAVCSNATGGYMVRHGEKECRVILETDDDQVIEWRRASKKVNYVVNGESIDRTHGQVPEKVAQALRMGKVEAERDEFDVHFGEQKSPIFLLDSTASQRAAFFASSSDAARLIEMQTVHKTKVSEANRDCKTLQKRETDLRTQLESLQPVEKIQQEIECVEQLETELVELERRCNHSAEVLTKLLSENENLKRHVDEAKVLGRLQKPPQFTDDEELAELIEEIQSVEGTQSHSKQQLELLKEMPTELKQIAIRSLDEAVRQLERYDLEVQRLQRTAKLLDLPEVPQLKSAVELQNTIEKLQSVELEVKLLERTCATVGKVDQPDLQKIEEPLAKQIHAIHQLMQDIEELGRETEETQLETSQVHDELHALLKENGECPTCGQKLISAGASNPGGGDHE